MQPRIAPAGGAPAPTLGTYAKCSSPPDERTPIRAVRAERYALQATARLLFSAEGRKHGFQYGHDIHRTAKCKHITRGGGAAVHRDRDRGAAFYSGLVTCGSVWACPICAAVVQERRREEIAQAIDWAYAQDLQPVMVTLTFPHHLWNQLQDLLDGQSDAFRRLRSGKAWQRFKRNIGYRGLIRSLELTHGKEHGWHPHTHELWLVDKHIEAADLQAEIVTKWAAACERAGLLSPAQIEDFRRYSVDVKGWCSTSDYLAKQDDSRHWGADREIAKATTKRGGKKGLHPFGLLADAQEGDEKAGKLFLDYARAMKGKRQLFWSRGLKELVGLNDVSDEQLAEESRESADLLGSLTTEEWRAVRSAGMRSQVLDAAEIDGWTGVQAVVMQSFQIQQAASIQPGEAGHSSQEKAVIVIQTLRGNAANDLAFQAPEQGDFPDVFAVDRLTGELRRVRPPPS